MRSDIIPRGTSPDYALPDHENITRKLREIQGEDPLILTLARGHYCPKEHQQHLELAANYAKIAVAYTRIATISTETHHSSQEFRASTGAQWPFLSDPERIVQKDLDIQEYTDPEHDPMIPHTLVLRPGLVIHSVYNGYWFWGRPSFVDLWHDLRAVTREIRPDWDLSKPELREAWDAGQYSPFHGWDRRSRDSMPTSYESQHRGCGLRGATRAERARPRFPPRAVAGCRAQRHSDSASISPLVPTYRGRGGISKDGFAEAKCATTSAYPVRLTGVGRPAASHLSAVELWSARWGVVPPSHLT